MRLIAAFLVLVSLVSCNRSNYEGYKLADSGLNYKFLSIGDGKKVPAEGDYLTIHFSCELDIDSFIDGRQMLKLHQLENKNSIIETLLMMKEGDSLSAYLPANELRKYLLADRLKVGGDELLKTNIKLIRLRSNDQFIQDKKDFFSWLTTNQVEDVNLIKEQRLIDEYISNQDLDFSITPTGLYYCELKEGKGSLVDFGESVIIHFEGYTIDGFKFDSTKERRAWFDFIIGQDNQVIKGIEEGLFLMNKKSKYRFVIPSHLAFKDAGTINGKVKPFSPVIYDVELIDKR